MIDTQNKVEEPSITELDPIVNTPEFKAAVSNAVEQAVELIEERAAPHPIAPAITPVHLEICPGCGFDVSREIGRIEGLAVVECVRCGTAFIPDKPATPATVDDISTSGNLAQDLKAMKITEPTTFHPNRRQRSFDLMEQDGVFEGASRVAFSRGGIVIAALSAGLVTDGDSPVAVTLKPE